MLFYLVLGLVGFCSLPLLAVHLTLIFVSTSASVDFAIRNFTSALGQNQSLLMDRVLDARTFIAFHIIFYNLLGACQQGLIWVLTLPQLFGSVHQPVWSTLLIFVSSTLVSNFFSGLSVLICLLPSVNVARRESATDGGIVGHKLRLATESLSSFCMRWGIGGALFISGIVVPLKVSDDSSNAGLYYS